MRTFALSMALVAALSTSAHALHSVNVGPLYNTGVNSNGLSLANGAIDQHWLVNPTGENTETPANTQPTAATSAFGFPIPPWLGDDHKSDWIAPNASLMGPNAPDGTAGFIYSTTFDVSSAGTITISGGAGADNGVLDVQINNGPLQAFSNPSGFGGAGSVFDHRQRQRRGEHDQLLCPERCERRRW